MPGIMKNPGAGIVMFTALNPVTLGHKLFVPVWHRQDASTEPR